MKSYKTPYRIKVDNELRYNFKRYYNKLNKTNHDLHSRDLYGLDCHFKLWLHFEKGITDLALYLDSLEANTSLKSEYHKTGKRVYNK